MASNGHHQSVYYTSPRMPFEEMGMASQTWPHHSVNESPEIPVEEMGMASHGWQHHSVSELQGMSLEEIAMQQPMPMHYTQQVQQPDQMLMGGGVHGVPTPQFHEHLQPQFHAQVQPQFQEQMQMQPQPQVLMAQQVQQQLFWKQQLQEVQEVKDFKKHPLPLAKIKKIMKSDPAVEMVAFEALVFFAKACEMFILDLTQRSWRHTEQNNRRTLQTSHVTSAIHDADKYDFLQDHIPGCELEGVSEMNLNLIVNSSIPGGLINYPPMVEQVTPQQQHMGQQPLG